MAKFNEDLYKSETGTFSLIIIDDQLNFQLIFYKFIYSLYIIYIYLHVTSCSGPVSAKMIPIRSGSGSVRIFDPVAHCI